MLHVHAVGPVVRVTLSLTESRETLESELTRDIFEGLRLQKGELVYVRPRRVRVFVEDYQI